MKKIWKISLGTTALISPLSMVVACGKASDAVKKDDSNPIKSNDDSVSNLKNALDGTQVYTLQDVANTQTLATFNEDVLNTFGFTVDKFPSADLLKDITMTYKIKDGADADKKIIEVTMTKGDETGIINLNLTKLKDETAINAKMDEIIRARLGDNEKLKPFLDQILAMGSMHKMINLHMEIIKKVATLTEEQENLYNRFLNSQQNGVGLETPLTDAEKAELKKPPFITLTSISMEYSTEANLFNTELKKLQDFEINDIVILLNETIQMSFLMSGRIADYKEQLEQRETKPDIPENFNKPDNS